MKLGYARISLSDQNLQEQIDSLISFGCDKVFFDAQTHFHKHQPELDRCLAHLNEGDSFIVNSLQHLGLNIKHFVKLMEGLNTQSCHFISIQQHIDTSNDIQPSFMSLMQDLHSLEQSISSEQLHSGLSKARLNGKKGGRPPQIEAFKKETAYAMYINKTLPLTQIAKTLGISRMTIYRYIEQRQQLLRNTFS